VAALPLLYIQFKKKRRLKAFGASIAVRA